MNRIAREAYAALDRIEDAAPMAAQDAIRECRAALALPPGPAPRMEEIENAVREYGSAVQSDAAAYDWGRSQDTASAAKLDLLSAIRTALGAARAEGWEAGREAGAKEADREDFGIAALIRRLPSPTQDKDGER